MRSDSGVVLLVGLVEVFVGEEVGTWQVVSSELGAFDVLWVFHQVDSLRDSSFV